MGDILIRRTQCSKSEFLEIGMKALVGCASVIFALASIASANAKGCIKGAVIGGVAGHYAGHHGLIGAATGCVIGHHEAKERARLQKEQEEQGQPIQQK
jgi:hypothetical protein